MLTRGSRKTSLEMLHCVVSWATREGGREAQEEEKDGGRTKIQAGAQTHESKARERQTMTTPKRGKDDFEQRKLLFKMRMVNKAEKFLGTPQKRNLKNYRFELSKKR